MISADSMQIYRRLGVGTAKPTADECARAPIHLIDFVEPDQPYSVADFQRDARKAIAGVHERGRLPILCGGTGLYIRAVLRGFRFPIAEPAATQKVRERLQEEAQSLGLDALHERLRRVDPVAAGRIQPADARRIIRALEVTELTGKPMSEQQRVDESGGLGYNAAYFVITSPRELLYRRIEARVDAMLAAGWVAEVEALREQGYSPSLQSLQAIGYRRLLQYLAGERGWDESVRLIKQETRQFAKRQETWFRRDTDAVWLSWADGVEFDSIQTTIEAALPHLPSGEAR